MLMRNQENLNIKVYTMFLTIAGLMKFLKPFKIVVF